jgi:hypothetical protein
VLGRTSTRSSIIEVLRRARDREATSNPTLDVEVKGRAGLASSFEIFDDKSVRITQRRVTAVAYRRGSSQNPRAVIQKPNKKLIECADIEDSLHMTNRRKRFVVSSQN